MLGFLLYKEHIITKAMEMVRLSYVWDTHIHEIDS